MKIDFYILAFSAVTVLATIWMGFRSAKKSKTASDFFVAGRSVGVGMNASAISGEYLSAASFMGIAGMVMSSGYDALWYPVCYACGYLFLLLFIAGPLRRFGAYTIPDFAEGRFDSPVFRKIAVVFVLFIGFFYTMPQMKGAGTTLAYIFPGLPYWAGVVLVGAVITLNVALGGMKGITLVQAFQYWAKMFAISVPIFVLMAVYGHYGNQLKVNQSSERNFLLPADIEFKAKDQAEEFALHIVESKEVSSAPAAWSPWQQLRFKIGNILDRNLVSLLTTNMSLGPTMSQYAAWTGLKICFPKKLEAYPLGYNDSMQSKTRREHLQAIETRLARHGLRLFKEPQGVAIVLPSNEVEARLSKYRAFLGIHKNIPVKAPSDETWLNPFGPLTTKAAKNAAAAIGKKAAAAQSSAKENFFESIQRTTAINGNSNPVFLKANELKDDVSRKFGLGNSSTPFGDMSVLSALHLLAEKSHGLHRLLMAESAWPFINTTNLIYVTATDSLPQREQGMRATFRSNGVDVIVTPLALVVVPAAKHAEYEAAYKRDGMAAFEPDVSLRRAQGSSSLSQIPLRAGLSSEQRMTVNLDAPTIAQALGVYAELTGRQLVPNTNSLPERVDDLLGGKLSKLKIISRASAPDSGVREHGDGGLTAAEVKAAIEAQLRTNGIMLVAVGDRAFAAQRAPGILPGSGLAQTGAADYSTIPIRQDAGGTLAADAQKAWLDKHEKPLALLYTYSLIIAIVCGTAGLPHILVRFYTNPDGTAAKKTTMWVMILIGVFYVFPPVFGVFGRNFLPELYAATGAKGTDKIVLELPRLLNERYAPLGSVLSGITCAGAFAAFMSTFSGLLVSMTGALAHDVYGRILRPKATAEQRMRMFKIGAVIIGAVAILLGMQVEQLQINFMVGQAFAIAAASYFPLLFMAVWWRKLTMKGAATGMLTGGLAALICISLTSFSDLATAPKASWFFQLFAGLNPFWAAHPLLRILAEQPAIWAVPLAIGLMIIVSKLTARDLPADIRMKMLVLHAPEQLGLKQEYIQEHQHGH